MKEIILVGRAHTGKSTILNSLAGKKLFSTGKKNVLGNLGLNTKTHNDILFTDTHPIFRDGHQLASTISQITRHLNQSLKVQRNQISIAVSISFKSAEFQENDIKTLKVLFLKLSDQGIPTSNKISIIANYIDDKVFNDLSKTPNAKQSIAEKLQIHDIPVSSKDIWFLPFQRKIYRAKDKAMPYTTFVPYFLSGMPLLSVVDLPVSTLPETPYVMHRDRPIVFAPEQNTPHYAAPQVPVANTSPNAVGYASENAAGQSPLVQPFPNPVVSSTAAVSVKPGETSSGQLFNPVSSRTPSTSILVSTDDEIMPFVKPPTSTMTSSSKPAYANHNSDSIIESRQAFPIIQTGSQTGPGSSTHPLNQNSPLLTSQKSVPAPSSSSKLHRSPSSSSSSSSLSEEEETVSPVVAELQSNIKSLETELDECKTRHYQFEQKENNLRMTLQATEMQRKAVEAKMKGCEEHISNLQPVLQLYLDDATEMKKKKAAASSNSNSRERKQCSICLSKISRSNAYALECGHVYHPQCVKNWLTQKNTCPVCKREVY